ncbi:hypothetical protein [uncultured Chitinophaga sp.]|uniref:hypothetical protein n=1 Tax=uncultured Chitinophaga sp. TaxID=339340 RepID=UPI0026375355|nr:hypothetical protein [uncultured Chitinophaga sp.]
MPRTIIIAAAAMMLTTASRAQHNVLAYNGPAVNKTLSHAVTKEAPVRFKVNLTRSGGDSLVFRLRLENATAEKVVLMIKDKNANVLHREVIPATPVYVGRYNLQSLEDGDYTFELRNGRDKIAEKTIGIRTELAVNRIGSVQ